GGLAQGLRARSATVRGALQHRPGGGEPRPSRRGARGPHPVRPHGAAAALRRRPPQGAGDPAGDRGMRRDRAVVLLVLGLLLLAGCGGPAKTAGAPVILISIDTLRSDHLPAYGYGKVETPAIDAFAKDAVLFERAYSHYPLTLPSHVSILTGELPPVHKVRDNAGYP